MTPFGTQVSAAAAERIGIVNRQVAAPLRAVSASRVRRGPQIGDRRVAVVSRQSHSATSLEQHGAATS